MRPRPILSATPTVSLAVLALALGTHAALKALFFWRPYLQEVALPIETATGGLVTTVTLAGLISWAVLVGGVLLAWGGLRLADLGLTGRSLREALPILVGLWAIAQVAHALVGTASGGTTLAASMPSWSAAIGLRVQAVVGSGLLEETLYRGFLMVQVFALLRVRTGREQALAWAIVASSLYFGLNHIPAGLRAGLPLLEAVGFAGYSALVGGMFAVLYVRTGNLFVAAGAHALINDPVPLFSAPVDPSVVVLTVAAVMMLAWPVLAERYRFTVGTVEGAPAI
ncbi:MAG: CPBP family intramembrane glutamic endopeptidase [Bacteroidota bacterium]